MPVEVGGKSLVASLNLKQHPLDKRHGLMQAIADEPLIVRAQATSVSPPDSDGYLTTSESDRHVGCREAE
jgi:hypothetical protein